MDILFWMLFGLFCWFLINTGPAGAFQFMKFIGGVALLIVTAFIFWNALTTY